MDSIKGLTKRTKKSLSDTDSLHSNDSTVEDEPKSWFEKTKLKLKTFNIQEHPKIRRSLAITLFGMHSILLWVSAALCKIGYFFNKNLDGYDYMLVRNFGMISFALVPIYTNKINVLDVKPNHRWKLFAVMTLLWLGMINFFNCLKYLPTFKATLVFSLGPIFVSILSIILLGEIISKYDALWIGGAFWGMVIIMMNKSNVGVEASYMLQTIWLLRAILSWVITSLGTVFVRYFNKEHNSLVYPFYYSFALWLQTVLYLILSPSVFHFSEYGIYDVSAFLLSGLLSVIGKQLWSYSYNLEEVSKLAPFLYLSNITSIVLDVTIFNLSICFTDIIGSLVILVFLQLRIRHD